MAVGGDEARIFQIIRASCTGFVTWVQGAEQAGGSVGTICCKSDHLLTAEGAVYATAISRVGQYFGQLPGAHQLVEWIVDRVSFVTSQQGKADAQ